MWSMRKLFGALMRDARAAIEPPQQRVVVTLADLFGEAAALCAKIDEAVARGAKESTRIMDRIVAENAVHEARVNRLRRELKTIEAAMRDSATLAAQIDDAVGEVLSDEDGE